MASSEILGAILSNQSGTELRSRGKAFITDDLKVDLGNDVDINVVENTNGSVNLALPYYDGMEEHTKAKAVDVQGVSGGAGDPAVNSLLWPSVFLLFPAVAALLAAQQASDSAQTVEAFQGTSKYPTQGDC